MDRSGRIPSSIGIYLYRVLSYLQRAVVVVVDIFEILK